MSAAFASVVLDVDSTLCGIEGIDWLAGKAGDVIAREVASQTDRAMRGELKLEDVYAARLEIVRPGRSDIDELGSAYIDALAPGAAHAIASWHSRGIKVVLVSGGIRQCILPVAGRLGILPEDVHAVAVNLDAAGTYTGYDTMSRLTVATGKRDVVEALTLPRKVFAAGDGSTDLAMREVVDRPERLREDRKDADDDSRPDQRNLEGQIGRGPLDGWFIGRAAAHLPDADLEALGHRRNALDESQDACRCDRPRARGASKSSAP